MEAGLEIKEITFKTLPGCGVSREGLKRGIARQLRNVTSRRDRCACYVCGRHAAVSQLHHLTPIGELSESVSYQLLERETVTVRVVTVWLCPTHHAYWHLLRKEGQKTSGAFSAYSVLNRKEIEAYDRLNSEKEYALWGTR